MAEAASSFFLRTVLIIPPSMHLEKLELSMNYETRRPASTGIFFAYTFERIINAVLRLNRQDVVLRFQMLRVRCLVDAR